VDELIQCAVEGCLEATTSTLRFVDGQCNSTGEQPCHAHLGNGLILRIPLCDTHGGRALSKQGDVTHWSR